MHRRMNPATGALPEATQPRDHPLFNSGREDPTRTDAEVYLRSTAKSIANSAQNAAPLCGRKTGLAFSGPILTENEQAWAMNARPISDFVAVRRRSAPKKQWPCFHSFPRAFLEANLLEDLASLNRGGLS
jgi:hypothetical protein